ncbi:D123-domain-containing protein [Blyttiomyces helicus]|uniref:D123-domain-containing protein n=1 Tax=Blyttiomyces helicus TaxID=388810 RepID=A0A4P9WBG7_9FUNG|nr:D123-domain-containing protein [Blyttiomyces helicus]|eukprot:RKO89602.1 D123-domain-containing protein [Blyttiomyces helicus]
MSVDSSPTHPVLVFDVYINGGNRKVWLLDFNPYCRTTDSLLFAWEEIVSALHSQSPHPAPISGTPQFRVIDSHLAASSSTAPAYATNRLPRDAIDLSSGASIDEFAQRFRRQMSEATRD